MAHKWSAAKELKEIRAWLEKPGARASRLEKQLDEMRLLADGLSPGRLEAWYWLLAVWYQNEGVYKLMSDAPDAIATLNLAAYISTLELRSKAALRLAMPWSGTGTTEWNEAMNAFALGIQLGRVEDCRVTAETLQRGDSALFRGFGGTPVGCYVVNLYSLWSGVPLPSYLAKLQVIKVYSDVLANWDTTNIPALQCALLAACDYHAERSKWSTDTKTYDFDSADLALLPSEILAVLRLREMRGLELPVLDHPVMNTAAGKLYPVERITPDPVFEASYEAIIRNIDAYIKSTKEAG